MKLRIKGNSLRLRLARSEVAQLGSAGVVEEIVEFGPSSDQHFFYTLSTSDDIETPVATLGDNSILVLLPERLAREWIQTDRVSISGQQVIRENTTLHILVEKDFACLAERRDEDYTDSYPNPMPRRHAIAVQGN